MKKQLLVVTLGCIALAQAFTPAEYLEQLKAYTKKEVPVMRKELLESPLAPAYKGRSVLGAGFVVGGLGCLRNVARLSAVGAPKIRLLSLGAGIFGLGFGSLLAYDGADDAQSLLHDAKAYINEKIGRK